jgi:NADH:ubiquinone oxidoreductase subunit K
MSFGSILDALSNNIGNNHIFRAILLDAIHIELLFLLFAIFLLLALNIKTIKKQFISIKKKTWLILIIIFLFALFFRFEGEHNHFIFYDENYLNTIGRNILLYNTAGQCNYASFTSNKLLCNIIHPFTGWSVIMFVIYFLLGVSESISLYFTSFIGSLTIILVFLFSYLLFKKESNSLVAAFLFAISITHITWSKSSISNIISIFLILLLFIIVLIYCKENTKKLNFLVVLIIIYSIQTRIENLIYILIIFLIYFIFNKKILHQITSLNFLKPWGLFVILLPFYITQMISILFAYDDLYKGSFITIFSKNWLCRNP